MAGMTSFCGLGLCMALAAMPVEPPLSAVNDVANDRSASIARCLSLVDAVLDVVERHHIHQPRRSELETSFRAALRTALHEPKKEDRPKIRKPERLYASYLPDDFETLSWPAAIAAWWDSHTADAQTEAEFHSAVNQWLQSLPGGGALVSAEEHRVARQFAANQYVGIGIIVSLANHKFAIGKPVSGGPAERGGLQAGDEILAIDGWAVTQQLNEALARIRGEPGSDVIITFQRGDERRDVTITRGFIPFDSVTDLSQQILQSQIPPQFTEQRRIAGLHIARLSGSTVSELRQWERRMDKDGKKRALLLDLRSIQHDANVPALAVIADALVDSRALWHEVRRDDAPVVVPADRECLFRGMPVAVLVSDHTPAAGWILARALQSGRGAAIVHHQQWSLTNNPATGLPQVERKHEPESAALLLTDAVPIDNGRQVVHVATREIRFPVLPNQHLEHVWKSIGPSPGMVAVVRRKSGEPAAADASPSNARSAEWMTAYRQLQAALNPGLDSNPQTDVPVALACDWLKQQLTTQEASE